MRSFVSLVQFSLASTVSTAAFAQSIDGRVGLAIEVPVLDVRHLSQDVSVPTTTPGESTTTSIGQTATQIGLFTSGAGLDAKYGLSNQSILGARLALRRETLKSDGSSTAAHSQLSLLPRFEYYMAPDDSVRPHLGLEAGYERSTTNGSAGVTSNLWLMGPTGGVSYFPWQNWSLDVNASLYFITGSESIAGQSASTGGYGGVLRVALSGWFGGKPSEATAATEPTKQPMQPLTPETPPSEEKVVSGRLGAVQRVISVAPDVTLTLTTHPITSPESVTFQLTMTGSAGAFSGCESFAVSFDGNRIEASQTHRRARAGGFSAEESLVGSLPVDVLEAASQHKGNSEIVACQHHWPLKSAHLEHMSELKTASDMIARGDGLVAGNTSAVDTHDDSVVTELLLSRDASLKLEAKPLVSPYVMNARFISRSQNQTNVNCSEVNILADGQNLKIDGARANRQSSAAGTENSVEGRLTFVDLAHIAAGSDDEVIDACGQRANISPSNREQTWAFIAQSVSLAKRLGVWRGYRAPVEPVQSPAPEPATAKPDSAKHKNK